MRALAILLLCVPFGTGGRCEAARQMMVVATDHVSAEAGLQILRGGGTAADAAVAVLMVLSVVEPQASGIGGGAVLVYFDAASRRVTSWDGRETAPAATLAGSDAKPAGGRAVGVPGAVRMLEALHHEHGRLPWADLLAPAIRLAEAGVPVSPPLAEAVAGAQDELRRQKLALSVLFAANGAPLAAGATLTNPALAQSLRAVASAGAGGLLRGPIAAEIATAVRSDPQSGLMTTDDLAAYTPHSGEPACAPYRSHMVCTPPPPAAGLMLLQILGVLDRAGLAEREHLGADAAAMVIEADLLAAADRARYLADPAFVPVPTPALLADSYLAGRAQQIDPAHAITAGAGANAAAPGTALPPVQPEHGTSSIAIVDAQGNAVGMTATLGDVFGAKIFVHGFFLNAALGDFSTGAAPGAFPGPGAVTAPGDSQPVNQIQPGKRPATAMTPAIVLDETGGLAAVLGSTGGARMPGYAAQALTGLLGWGLDPAAALGLPHLAADAGEAMLEADTPAADLAAALAERQFAVTVGAMPSATALIATTPAGLAGAADRRGDGAVAAAQADR